MGAAIPGLPRQQGRAANRPGRAGGRGVPGLAHHRDPPDYQEGGQEAGTGQAQAAADRHESRPPGRLDAESAADGRPTALLGWRRPHGPGAPRGFAEASARWPRRLTLMTSAGLRQTDQAARCLVMGVVNVTPDSFSDGGTWLDPDKAIAHGLELASQGADIVDVGGESTRPGADRVPAEDELRRVIPVVGG